MGITIKNLTFLNRVLELNSIIILARNANKVCILKEI